MGYRFSELTIPNWDSVDLTSDLEAGLQQVDQLQQDRFANLPGAGSQPTKPLLQINQLQPNRKGELSLHIDQSDVIAICNLPVKLPNGQTKEFVEILKNTGRPFSIQGDKKGVDSKLNPAVAVFWNPGAPDLRILRVRSMPSATKLEQWAALDDAQLGQALKEHFFLS